MFDGSFYNHYFEDLADFAERIDNFNYTTAEVILNKDYFGLQEEESERVRSLILTKGILTLDLAGNTFSDCAILLINSDLVIKDSSVDNSGELIATENIYPTIYLVENSSVTVNGGNISGALYVGGGVYEDSLGYSFTVNGGSFTDFVFYIDDSENPELLSVSVKNATFENVSVDGEGVTLRDIFSDAECLTYTVADGSPEIDFTLTDYVGCFTVSHDDSHADSNSYKYDTRNHWFECVNGVKGGFEAHSYDSGATCDVCGAEAPIVLESDGNAYGFFTFAEAISAASVFNSSKITLNTDVMLMPLGAEAQIMIQDCDVEIDLNGNTLYIYSIYIYYSDVTFTDSSAEGSGEFIFYQVNIESSRTVLKNITIGSNFVSFYIAYSEVVFDRAYAKAHVMMSLNNSVPNFIHAVFDNGMGINEESYSLAYILGTECVTVTDADGEALIFAEDEYFYDGKITVVHDSEYSLTDWVYYEYGIHAKYCFYCNLLESKEECSGGEATCEAGEICEKCGYVYGEALEHSYIGDRCSVCGDMANLTVICGEEEFYFQYAYDAFLKADSFDSAVIILNNDYNFYDTPDIEIKNADVILDLNGFSFESREINIYGGSLTIIDSSAMKSGYFYADSTLDVYNGALIIEGGEFEDFYVDLDPEDMGYAAAIVIEGGYFDFINIDTDFEGDLFIDIRGGTFNYLELDIDDPTVVSVSGGEIYAIYSEGGSYLRYIEDIINVYDCVKMLDENGRRIYFDSESVEYYGYARFVHDPTASSEPELNYGILYHWYECECKIMSDKALHTGGVATCNSLAVCEICEAEYGYYSSHVYDDNLKCTVCGDEASGSVKIETDSFVEYFDSFYEAINAVEYIGENATVTLLDNVTVAEEYILVDDVEYIIDLNGFTLKTDAFEIGDGRLVITDTSESGDGMLCVAAGIVIHEGGVRISGGTVERLNILISENYPSAEIVIEGGSIGRFVLQGNGNVIFTGGEIINGITIIYTDSMTIGDIVPYGCYSLADENGESIVGLDNTRYDGYVTVIHTDTFEPSEAEDGHVDTCLCGKLGETADHDYDNACDADCNICGAQRTPEDHVYDNACDADCNVCEEARTPADHVYDNACDAGCNVCAIERTPAEHVYDSACDKECIVCSAIRSVAHVFDKIEVKEEPTHGASGIGIAICSVCGASEEVIIPEKSGLPGWSVVLISVGSTAAVGAGGFSLLWFVIKKKKWSDLIRAFKK